jgi:flagellar biosynthesis protein FliR
MPNTSPALAFSSLVSGNSSSLVSLYPTLLVSLRIAVVLALTPILSGMPVPARIRALIVLSLALVLALGLPSGSQVIPNSTGVLIQAAFIELTLGATLALGILLAFAAFAVAGSALDIQIGFGIAHVFDPISSRPAPLVVSAFNYVAVLVFFLVDGHHALLRGIAYSLERFPVGAYWSPADVILPVIKQVAGLFSLGFALAAPVIFCIFLVELALGTVARNLPQINMFALGIPVKIIVGVAALSFWFAGMGGTMNRIYGSIYSTWDEMFKMAPTGQPIHGPSFDTPSYTNPSSSTSGGMP